MNYDDLTREELDQMSRTVRAVHAWAVVDYLIVDYQWELHGVRYVAYRAGDVIGRDGLRKVFTGRTLDEVLEQVRGEVTSRTDLPSAILVPEWMFRIPGKDDE